MSSAVGTPIFAETLKMLHEMAAEQGIDLDNLPPVEIDKDNEALKEEYFEKTLDYGKKVSTWFQERQSQFEALGLEWQKHFEMDATRRARAVCVSGNFRCHGSQPIASR